MLTILLEVCNDLLAAGTDEPLGELGSLLRIGSLLANEQTSRVQQRVASIVRTSLVDDGLVTELGIDGEDGAAVGDSVLLEKNGSSQGLYGEANVLVVPLGVGGGPGDLANASPEERLLDVGGRLVVPGEETGGRGGGSTLSSLVQVGEDGADVVALRDVGGVGLGTNQEEVVAEGIVDLLLGDALLDSDILSGEVVGNADVDGTLLQVLDAVSGITGDPCDSEGFAAVGNAVLDESIGQLLWKVSKVFKVLIGCN